MALVGYCLLANRESTVTAQEYYEKYKQYGDGYDAMESWSLGMFKLVMKFAEAYADHRELEVRKELSGRHS